MKSVAQLIFLACSLGAAWCAHDLSSYPFKATLNPAKNGTGLYELYWNFDNAEETISFAVRAQTTGWVGFGLSPNGQMPNSDVVIGWVTDEGQTVFHDRFAERRDPPTIDEQQDWVLIGGEEENGFTILEFSRKYVTCDKYDLPITAETARVLWSFHATTDPTSEDIPRSLAHTSKGAVTLNLLGGLTDSAPDPSDLDHFDITVDNIVIPDVDTTYWCAALKFPENILNETKYITKFGPVVAEGNEAHVHHLLIYLCEGINDTHVGISGECEEGLPEELDACRGGTLIAAWAVGGELFAYPENVAFPVGGEGFTQYILIELHYDNPKLISGTVDSSGMRMWFTSTPRQYDAGIITFGHRITRDQIIPPNAKNFTTTALLTEKCTNTLLPKDGIRLFANLLHTHEAGHGLLVQHFRKNSECDVFEELEPIDKNLKYDFNYQQFNHLQREVIIKRGDIIQLKCFMGQKVQMVSPLSGEQLVNGGSIDYSKLDDVDWDVEQFQQAVHESMQTVICSGKNNGLRHNQTFPEIGCSYIAPDQCSDSTPPTCCERISATEDGVALRVSAALFLSLSLLTAILG